MALMQHRHSRTSFPVPYEIKTIIYEYVLSTSAFGTEYSAHGNNNENSRLGDQYSLRFHGPSVALLLASKTIRNELLPTYYIRAQARLKTSNFKFRELEQLRRGFQLCRIKELVMLKDRCEPGQNIFDSASGIKQAIWDLGQVRIRLPELQTLIIETDTPICLSEGGAFPENQLNEAEKLAIQLEVVHNETRAEIQRFIQTPHRLTDITEDNTTTTMSSPVRQKSIARSYYRRRVRECLAYGLKFEDIRSKPELCLEVYLGAMRQAFGFHPGFMREGQDIRGEIVFRLNVTIFKSCEVERVCLVANVFPNLNVSTGIDAWKFADVHVRDLTWE